MTDADLDAIELRYAFNESRHQDIPALVAEIRRLRTQVAGHCVRPWTETPPAGGWYWWRRNDGEKWTPRYVLNHETLQQGRGQWVANPPPPPPAAPPPPSSPSGSSTTGSA